MKLGVECLNWIAAISLAILLAMFIWYRSGADLVFRGGEEGKNFTFTTPGFHVEHDWGLDIESSDVIRTITLSHPEDPNDSSTWYFEPQRLHNDSKAPIKRFEQVISIGGHYQVAIAGSGVFRVTIRLSAK